MRKSSFIAQLNYSPHNMGNEKGSDRIEGQTAALDKQIAVLNKIMIGSSILAAALFISTITILSILVMELKNPVKNYAFMDWFPLLVSRMCLSATCGALGFFFRWLFLQCLKSIHHFHKEKKTLLSGDDPYTQVAKTTGPDHTVNVSKPGNTKA